ncbi:MAG: hypothetical protein IPH59_10675 [bacterium]|nr:hypothetical protein [bacterium]
MMNARNLIIGIAALIAAAITSAGCYTIIKHPTMTATHSDEGEGTSETYTHVEADRDCMRCHTDYGTYPYGYYYGYYPDYYWSNPNWGSYYAYPWWWEDYYDNDKIVADTVDQIARPEQRRGLTPPYSRGVDPIFNPPPTLPTPGTPPVVGGSGGSTTGGGGTVTPPPTNTDDGKKEEQKPPRRRGK